MFPLGNVLFPHMPLPLRVFEQRYLIMLGNLLESPTPEFGVVLIERGHEVGGGEQRGGIGTMARIVEVDARAGFVGLVAIGTDRLRVVEWLPDEPFPRADVEAIDPLEWDDSLLDLHAETESRVREALLAATDPGPEYSDDPQVNSVWPPDTAVADDPLVSSWQLAAITPVGPLDAAALLASATTEELLVRTRDLAREAAETAVLLRRLPPDRG